jgi:hypothetical protein
MKQNHFILMNSGSTILIIEYFVYFYAQFAGELAQLARAIAWHAIGQGFDSPILHNIEPDVYFGYSGF